MRHVRAVDVAHDENREEEHRRVGGMQPDQAVDHPFVVLVAQVIPGDERDEEEPD
jgi:hypothetical protein